MALARPRPQPPPAPVKREQLGRDRDPVPVEDAGSSCPHPNAQYAFSARPGAVGAQITSMGRLQQGRGDVEFDLPLLRLAVGGAAPPPDER